MDRVVGLGNTQKLSRNGQSPVFQVSRHLGFWKKWKRLRSRFRWPSSIRYYTVHWRKIRSLVVLTTTSSRSARRGRRESSCLNSNQSRPLDALRTSFRARATFAARRALCACMLRHASVTSGLDIFVGGYVMFSSTQPQNHSAGLLSPLDMNTLLFDRAP